MSFIRVTTKKNAVKLDLNLNHIVHFETHQTGEGSYITMIDGTDYEVTNSSRSLRGYIKKAQGTLPEKATASAE